MKCEDQLTQIKIPRLHNLHAELVGRTVRVSIKQDEYDTEIPIRR